MGEAGGPPFVLSKGHVVDKKDRHRQRNSSYLIVFSLLFCSELQKEEVQVRNFFRKKIMIFSLLFHYYDFVLRHTST